MGGGLIVAPLRANECLFVAPHPLRERSRRGARDLGDSRGDVGGQAGRGGPRIEEHVDRSARKSEIASRIVGRDLFESKRSADDIGTESRTPAVIILEFNRLIRNGRPCDAELAVRVRADGSTCSRPLDR